MMTMIMMLLSTVSSSLSLSSLLRNSLVIPIITFSISVNAAMAADLDNGSKLFLSSCSSCHAGGGNVTPFSGGKTLSIGDLKSNGYDSVDNVISIVNKVYMYIIIVF